MKNMTIIDSSLESSARKIFETVPGVARPLAAMPPKAQPRRVSRHPETTSLPDLVRNLRPGHRSEDVAWMILACSALVLLALSFWL